MVHHESVQFHTYKEKTYIVQYKIETSSYERFKYRFSTDKYINLCQWEYICSKLKSSVSSVLKQPESWKDKKNKFSIDDLVISYKFVDKSEGIVNYESVNYDLDWIIKATIDKISTIQDSVTVQESQSSTTSPKKRSSSSKEIISQNNENLLIDTDDDDDDDDEHVHESKKAKLDEDLFDKLVALKPSNRYNLKSRKDKNDTGRQTSIKNFITHRKEKVKSQKTKDPVTSTSKDVLSQFDEERVQHLKNFIVRTEQEEKKTKQRKEELKDYKILNCYDMDNDKIVEVIKGLEFEINCLFDNDSNELTTRKSAKINPCDITASNILTEKQTLFVLRTLEEFRSDEDKVKCEDVFFNVALPRVIIELFTKHHNLKREEAVERIKTQEEKKSLFKEEFNESY